MKATANKSKRTYTLRTESGSKYRTHQMSKQDFLEGKEFKIHHDSETIYKYAHKCITKSFKGHDFIFEACIEEITEDGFEAFASVIGEIFRVKLEFKNLI